MNAALGAVLAVGAPNSGTHSPFVWVIAITFCVIVGGSILFKRGSR